MRRLSPSMIVSIVAVVLAGAGTSIAAVNFAKNAGAVDGKSAVGHFTSNAKAAGKVVATGAQGKLPARFLDLSKVVAGTKSASTQGIEVTDNAASAPVAIASVPGLGILAATCKDAAAAAGTEDPEVTLTFANGSGQVVNWMRRVGRGASDVQTLAAGTQTEFTIAGSNDFEIYAQVGTTHWRFQGVVRQEGRNSAAGLCAMWGSGLTL